jgi:hypothetical protein
VEFQARARRYQGSHVTAALRKVLHRICGHIGLVQVAESKMQADQEQAELKKCARTLPDRHGAGAPISFPKRVPVEFALRRVDRACNQGGVR